MEKELESIGFTSGESRVYLSLLKLGPSTVGPIASKSKVSYSKIYEVLDRLAKKGIVTIVKKEKTRFFQSVNPKKLLEIAKKQEQEIRENKEKLTKIIPELENYEKSYSKNDEAEIFKGIKGIQTAYEILLKETTKKEEMYLFYVYDKKYNELVDEFYSKMFPVYKEFGHKWKGITTKDYESSIKKQPSFIKFRVINFPVPSNIDMSNDSILITIWSEEPTAILIKSREIAQNYRKYFESVWAKGK